MTNAAPDWDLYRSFLAVLEAGSLSGAARKLGAAQPTVGRHIEALEQALGGGALFTRSPGGLRPTETALALREHALAMAVAAQAFLRTASGEATAVRGVIRLTASDVVGAEVLPPILRDFREAYPEVSLELLLSNQHEDLLHRGVDIAVRMARPTQGALFARRVGTITLGFYAHQSYLQAHGEPQTLADLRHHNLIGYDQVPVPPRFTREFGIPVTRELFALRSDSELAQLAALRAGFGICPCQSGIAARDPSLTPILRDQFSWELETWIVMHEDLKANRRMRLLFDHLVVGMSAYTAVTG